MTQEPQQLQTFLEIATIAAQAAGAVLRDCRGKLQNIEEKGGGGDLVTEADKQSEAAILQVLGRHVPEHRILAEESGKLGNIDSDYLWAIDPLDGTTNYAHNYPVACVSIALLIAGEPQIGVIYDPFADELFQAATGLGATLNRRPIRVSQTQSLEKSLLASGFAYDRRETSDNNYAEFCYLTHLTQGVRRAGSAALDLAAVACGRYDGYWERGIKAWDIAAGVVLVREAGGKVTAYDESPLNIDSGRVLATNGGIHSALSRALAETPAIAQWSKP
ncbi:inositol monophosphatase family protein [Oscillatoria sp. FACHB-1406]|uniref:inositol monophosphatase family protein n=1 Tax=Oscillatoria sp. FACHB-1406 TaxID=2692846 RepID=UPI001688595D|nr:inositol monophosphatase family protein [Oscillatoria sp. FACHB-1406]MBD2576985.1 inositol monophosphatase [Oscillatoria sp. FACHB-1406]